MKKYGCYLIAYYIILLKKNWNNIKHPHTETPVRFPRHQENSNYNQVTHMKTLMLPNNISILVLYTYYTMLCLTEKQKTGHFGSKFNMFVSRKSTYYVALSHFNSIKVDHATSVCPWLHAGCTPMFSGSNNEMLGRLSTWQKHSDLKYDSKSLRWKVWITGFVFHSKELAGPH